MAAAHTGAPASPAISGDTAVSPHRPQAPEARAPAKNHAASPVDAATAWAEVVRAQASTSAMAWIDHLSLQGFDAEHGIARVGLAASAADEGLGGFVNQERLEALGRLLTTQMGRRCRVELAAPRSQRPARQADGAGTQASMRRQASQLPWVRAVLETFPGAEVVDVRPAEASTEPQSEA
ncbi:MAG: hypothetical protein AAF288_11560 [Planctomycetota bacterium]